MSEIWENRPYLINNPFAVAPGMLVQDLPTRGKLSALQFEIEWANLAGGENSRNVLDLMTNIEIIHRGSEVIKAMSGIQHAGVAWRRGGNEADHFFAGNAGSNQIGVITIPFGRYPYDRQYGLTLDNLVNPQIRFTWNNAVGVQTDGAGGFVAAPAGLWSIRLLYAPDSVNYRGYIKTSVIDQWLSAAGATHFTEMPKNYKWPRIYLFQNTMAMDQLFNVNTLTIQADNRAWIPVDLDIWAIARLDSSQFGDPTVRRFCTNNNGIGIIQIPSLFDRCWESWATSNQAIAMEGRLQQGQFDMLMDFVNSAATDACIISETGRGFGRMYSIPFCPPNQEEQIDDMSLDSRKYGRIMVETLYNAGALANCPYSLILEELILGM